MMGDAKPEMVAGENTVATAPPVQPRIAGPMPCVKCLYDLSGLEDDQTCPECGTEAVRTLGSLATASVDALTRLRRALLYIGLAMTAGPAVVLMAFWGAGWVANSFASRSELAAFLVLMFAATGPVLSSIGWRQFEDVRTGTALDPFAAPGPKSIPQSNLLRKSALIFALMFLAMPIVIYFLFRTNDTFGIVFGIGAICGMYLCWALRTYIALGALGELRQRMTSDAGLTIVRGFRLVIDVMACAAVVGIAMLILGRPAGPWPIVILYLCLLGTSAFAMACGIWMLLLRRRATMFLIPALARSQQARADDAHSMT